MLGKSTRYGIWVAALLVMGGSACGGDSGTGGVCATMISKYRQCKLFTPGRVSCDELEARRTLNDCQLDCLRNASCEELRATVCDGEESSHLETCVWECVPHFECADGSDTLDTSSVCDDWEDCADGSDEWNCPAAAGTANASLQCADESEMVSASDRCDGWRDCGDGSDELGCPAGTSFQCADGVDLIPARFECDGDEDCEDGSDELGCSTRGWFQCADGSGLLPPKRVCDLQQDCEDGSDEAQGCATWDASCRAAFEDEVLED